MGNKSSPSIDQYNKSKELSLKKFQEQIQRKMTIHILSNKSKDCKDFIEYFTNEKVINSKELLEKDINKKINLYSFMNYKIYDNASNLAAQIEKKVQVCSNFPKKTIFSEVLIILDNEEINAQIKIIREKILNNNIISTRNYYFPFLIILSPRQLALRDFFRSKTFHYKITLKDILNFTKKNDDEDKKAEVSAFLRKLQVLFSYYNELGDEFSFLNSEDKEELIKIEDDTDISVFINILLLGRSGSGKSTLINLLLAEKKSLEGGTGFSTTSKNIVVYKKTGIPIRLYDVKGIENEKTLENYANILTDFNLNNTYSMDAINAIFYCIEYKNGTIIEQMEHKIFKKLIKFDIQIIFIITKTPYDINKKHKNKKIENARKNERDTIINAIKDIIILTFGDKKEDGKKYIDNYVKFYFVNLVTNLSLDVPAFGIDKVLSFFSETIPNENWENLEKCCFHRDENKCKEYCLNNPFLRYYSEFEKINTRNKAEARNYLDGLKSGAFFSGMIPGLDIGMEYFYKFKFKEKLKALYGFNYDRAEKIVKGENEYKSKETININISNFYNSYGINEEEIKLIEEKQKFKYNPNDFDIRTSNTKKEEEKIDSKIDEQIDNKGKNTVSLIRGIGEFGSFIVKTLPTAGTVTAKITVSSGLKIASWIFLPITCIGFGTWSLVKVDKDCNKILDIFDKAFTPLRFETLFSYIKSFRNAINYLKLIGEKINKDEDEDENENEEDYEEGEVKKY